jgi:hypothetical protein
MQTNHGVFLGSFCTLVVLMGVQGCVALDWNFSASGSGGAGGMASGGAGGMTASSTGISSSSSASVGPAGGGGMMGSTGAGILSDKQCFDDPSCGDECGTPKCDPMVGKCSWTNVVPAGLAPPEKQTYGDCITIHCTAIGEPLHDADDTDKYVWSNPCFKPDCSAGNTKSPEVIPETEPCGAKRWCGDCRYNSDCVGNYVSCLNGFCRPSSCSDVLQNSGETGVDCGGGCNGCQEGDGCNVDSDCRSDHCVNANYCDWPKCVDGRKNGNETDVDCGGMCAPTKLCASGKGCLFHSDCASGSCIADCTSGVCIPGICK